MKKLLITIAVVIFCLGGLVAVVKYDRLINLYRYVIYDEPYVNRTFHFSYNILSINDPTFNKVRFNQELDDSRGHFPDFLLPHSKQLTVKTSDLGLTAYGSFLDRYHQITNSHEDPETNLPDKLAFQIMGLVNELYERNLKKMRLNLSDSFQSEPDYRAEDFVYYLVNERTGCGEVAESTVALLRGAGFKARLLRLSLQPNPVMANHAFPEFYSEEHERWIMLEPMINASPRGKENNISAMEMMAEPSFREDMNQLWKAATGDEPEDYDLEYPQSGVVWFNQKGPQTNMYYFSGSDQSSESLKHSLVHGP